jgi:hypothetical protein
LVSRMSLTARSDMVDLRLGGFQRTGSRCAEEIFVATSIWAVASSEGSVVSGRWSESRDQGIRPIGGVEVR